MQTGEVTGQQIQTLIPAPSLKVALGGQKLKGKRRLGNRHIMLPEEVRERAEGELEYWKNLPKLKWTWGADLSRGDILRLFETQPARDAA